MGLPVLENRRAETSRCTFCPKLCRPACPVSTVTSRETLTPWGKMRAAGQLLREHTAGDADRAAPVYACTGCRACLELCELENPVADTLVDARADVLASGGAPNAIRRFIDDVPRREQKVRDRAASIPTRRARVAYFPGCTGVVFEPEEVDPVARAIGRLDAEATPVADLCCGLPLLEAGERDGFLQRARALGERLSGFSRIVVNDAGCMHAMREIYPRFGIALPPVRHVSELAASTLGMLAALKEPPTHVAYHDACRLGRGLGIYDPPRAVLTKVLGGAPLELPFHRERAMCSGGGGLLPISSRAVADEISAGLVGTLAGPHAQAIVTACATTRRRLAAQGVRAFDFAALVARAVREAT